MARLTKGAKLAVGFSLAMAVVFFILGGIAHGFSLKMSLFYFFLGAFLGAVAAPELEPKAFRWPVLWQISFAVIGCLVFAASVSAPLEGYILAGLLGVILGYSAPYWIKHVQGP